MRLGRLLEVGTKIGFAPLLLVTGCMLLPSVCATAQQKPDKTALIKVKGDGNSGSPNNVGCFNSASTLSSCDSMRSVTLNNVSDSGINVSQSNVTNGSGGITLTSFGISPSNSNSGTVIASTDQAGSGYAFVAAQFDGVYNDAVAANVNGWQDIMRSYDFQNHLASEFEVNPDSIALIVPAKGTITFGGQWDYTVNGFASSVIFDMNNLPSGTRVKAEFAPVSGTYVPVEGSYSPGQVIVVAPDGKGLIAEPASTACGAN